MNVLFESANEQWVQVVSALPRVGLALVAVLISVGVGRLVGRAARATVDRTRLPRLHKDFLVRAIRALAWLVGIAVGLDVLGLGNVIGALIAGGGFTAVVVGFAFREIGENFLAGLLLTAARPFRVGDVISSADSEGTVLGIELRATHIRTGDGRDVWIPNAQIVNSPLINFTLDGLRRGTFTVGIDYRDDAERACELLVPLVAALPEVLPEPAPAARLNELADSWVELQVSFWIDTEKSGRILAQVRSDAMNAVRVALLEAGYTVSADTTTNVALSGPSAESET